MMNFLQKKSIPIIISVLVAMTAIIMLVVLNRKKPEVLIKTIHKTDSFFADNSPIKKTIRHYADTLQREFDSSTTAGAAVTIVYKNKIVFIGTYGYRNVGFLKRVDKHTVFRLASVSKGFAGVLACLLEQDSIICLDDKVKYYLPDFQLKNKVNSDNLTIRHILSHTSGLVAHAFDNLADDKIPYPVILSELCNVDISAPPGQLYSYQNAIFSLLDTIIRVRTGQTYSEMLESKVFKPLRLSDASTGCAVFLNENANIAYPHILRGEQNIAMSPNLGYYDLMPAAGVNASISDMGRWLLALLGNKQQFINRDVLNAIETPVISTHLKRSYYQYWDRISSKSYSLGWRIYMYKGRKILYHGGYVKGYRSEVAFCPEENIGISFLQNSATELAAKAVPMFFNMWFAQEDTLSLPATKTRIVKN
jgi:beta-lactamase class C